MGRSFFFARSVRMQELIVLFHKRSMLLKLLIPYFVALLLPILTI